MSRARAGVVAGTVVAALALGFGVAYVAGADDGTPPPPGTTTSGFGTDVRTTTAPPSRTVTTLAPLPDIPDLKPQPVRPSTSGNGGPPPTNDGGGPNDGGGDPPPRGGGTTTRVS